MNRNGYTSQNVMAICDFDLRFTFVVAGWLGSVHDKRVWFDAQVAYAHYPHPPEGNPLFMHFLTDFSYLIYSLIYIPYKCRKLLPCGFRIPKQNWLSSAIQYY
jgi:hypothetical protein